MTFKMRVSEVIFRIKASWTYQRIEKGCVEAHVESVLMMTLHWIVSLSVDGGNTWAAAVHSKLSSSSCFRFCCHFFRFEPLSDLKALNLNLSDPKANNLIFESCDNSARYETRSLLMRSLHDDSIMRYWSFDQQKIIFSSVFRRRRERLAVRSASVNWLI